jgi:hypothetical protein
LPIQHQFALLCFGHTDNLSDVRLNVNAIYPNAKFYLNAETQDVSVTLRSCREQPALTHPSLRGEQACGIRDELRGEVARVVIF